MTRVVVVPQTLNDDAFEELLAGTRELGDERVLFDARHLRFADPYGMLSLLALGEYLRESPGGRPILHLPQNPQVADYFTRMHFTRAAEAAFELHNAPKPRQGAEGNVLLPITVINSHEDVHGVVDELNAGRISTLLSDQLGYTKADAIGFSMLLSEVSQNIIEHADAPGWVGIQTYRRWRNIDKRVAVIAVIDLGVGFKGSLAKEHAARFGDR
ncbi:MAG TPA: hypothetical protein VFQ39_20545, partial [Longimicrobium sp.]|nr:hypothetical protein [Longimicrobium sp.]